MIALRRGRSYVPDMARKLRVQFAGAIHHVTVRGVERRAIFTENRERERFLERLADGVETHGVRLYLFCLMTNHAHLVLETPLANLDKFMHGLETAYTVYFNLRNDRVGHLFQGRYGADLVEGDKYLLKLTRYVHLNPVCVKRVKELPLKKRRELLRAYRWSSYRSYIGHEKPLGFVDYAPVLAMAGAMKARRKQEYRKFVEMGLAKTDDEFSALMQDRRWGIGSAVFQAWMKEQHGDLIGQHGHPEDISFRRVGRTLPASQIAAIVCEELGIDEAELGCYHKGSLARPIAAKMLCKYGGLTQRAVAQTFGIKTGAAVSIQLKRLREAAGRPAVKRLLRRIDRRIRNAL